MLVRTAEHVVVPEGVTQIGVYAFKGCSELKEVTIPDGVTSIGANGKTLYYSLLKEYGTLTETQKAVVENGYMTVTQSHCSDWIITTTNPNPTSDNNENNGGGDNNNQNDNSNGKDDSDDNKNESPDTGENNAWVSGILLVMSVVLLGIARKRKIS